MSKHTLEPIRTPRRTKLSFDEFKAKTINYLQTQHVTPVEPKSRPQSKSRTRALSSGKVAKVVPGGTRPYLSEDSEEEFVIRKIIEERDMSISRVDEVSISKEASGSIEEEPKQAFETSIQQLKQKEVKVVEQKTLQRRQICMQVIAQLNGDKSCSFSMSQFEQSSGSETEKPSQVPEHRSALVVHVNNLIKDPRQKTDFLSAISGHRNKKLSLCLRGSEVEGVYVQGQSGFQLVFNLRSSPPNVAIKQIKKCYRLSGTTLDPLSITQVWTADAFSI